MINNHNNGILISSQVPTNKEEKVGGGMRHPFTSSELFNAFSGETTQRENKTMSCINNNHKNMWAPTNNVSNTFSPPSQVIKESRSKMGSQCYSDSLQSDGFKMSKIDFYPNQ